jgi:hypothetical protein
MVKHCLNLLVLCSVITGSASVALSQHASKALFNPPSWILGRWNNSAVANLNDSESFTFTAGEISFAKGFDKLKVVSFSRRFKDYKVKETIEPNLYRVEFYTAENELVYEFRPCEAAVCKTLSGQEGLTYSIIKNKKVVRAHETSINLLLFRPIRVK